MIEGLLHGHYRGAAKLRNAVRGGWPHVLLRSRTKHGLMFGLDPDSYIDKLVKRDGFYEEEVLDAILSNTGPNECVWDVGANFGLHCITLKHLVPKMEVVAFEPNPLQSARIQLNCRENDINIAICCFGLGAEDGVHALHVRNSGNSGLSSFQPWQDVQYEGSILAQVRSAFSLVANGQAPAPNAIKLDVEGFELAVLQGLNLPKLKSVTTIVYESGDAAHGEAAGKLLVDAGFEIRPVRSELLHSSTNFLAVRA
jgi:FkbM family methyltransferase